MFSLFKKKKEEVKPKGVKVCAECKHCNMLGGYTCCHPMLCDLITGDPTGCESNRAFGRCCGNIAIYWEARDPVDNWVEK